MINNLRYTNDLKHDEKPTAELEALVNTVTSDVLIKFEWQKCATLVIKKRMKIEGERASIPDGQLLQNLDEDSYKYLEVLRAGRIKK